jgi:hypothetical protein
VKRLDKSNHEFRALEKRQEKTPENLAAPAGATVSFSSCSRRFTSGYFLRTPPARISRLLLYRNRRNFLLLFAFISFKLTQSFPF